MIACTGWTWEYIDNHMTIPRLASMTRYWNLHPPVHVLVASYMGYEGKTEPKREAMSAADLEGLMATIPQVKR